MEAQKLSCSCGGEGKTRITDACSGIGSNFGQRANAAACQLAHEGYGSGSCLAGIGGGIERLVGITCSGLSNTGRLTTQVAMTLMSRSTTGIAWAQAHKGEYAIADAVDDADQIIVIEGCSDHCASKKLEMMGIMPDFHIVATESG